MVAGLIIGRNRGAYRIQAEQAAVLLAQREELQAEQRRADLLDERARIAREIHDVLAHSLGALGIQIQAARAVLADHRDIDRADEILAAAQRMAAEGLVETRRAVHALRAGTLPLDEELARVSDTYAQRYHVAATSMSAVSPAPLPPDATIALLRIAQESLVNAAKHAAGQSVAVRLDYSDADVRLTVRNDLAPGRRPGRRDRLSTVNGGYGLTGMRERLRLLNGTLQAGRRDNQWVVTAELPPRPSPGTAGAVTAPGLPAGPLRIVIADDQASVREGLVLLLGGLPGIEVVGAAADGEQALALVAEHHPDAILLDLHMPVLDGIGATRRLTAEHPDVAIVVLTTYADDASVLDALHAGARSYLTKDADRTHIAQALRAAAGGLTVFDPRAHATLLAAAGGTGQAGSRRGARPRRPDPARGRDPRAHRPRDDQPGDRREAVPQQPHDQDPHQPDLRQDRVQGPGRRHRLRAPPPHRLRRPCAG